MPLRRLLGSATGLPRTAVRAVMGAVEPRRVHRADDRTHIAVRGVHRPGAEPMAAALRKALLAIAGVTRAEVNGPLGLVMVLHDDDVPIDGLVDVVQAIEDAHDAGAEGFSEAAHAPNGRALAREAALAGAYVAAGGAAVVGTVLRRAPVPPGVATLLGMVDASPQVRGAVERRIGRTASDLVIGTGVAVGHALASQPTGPLINSAHRVIRLVELRSHRRTWHRRGKHLHALDGSFEAPALDVPPRPVPLPGGAVEHASWTIPAAITAALGTYAVSHDVGRAQGVLAAGIPKAARLGRDAFAAQLGMAASDRGVVVFHPEVLRRFDRIDRVVIDVSAFRTGELIIEEVVPVSDAATPEEIHERAHTLTDVRRLSLRHEKGGWSIAPLRPTRGGNVPALPEARDQVAAMRERGATVLLLSRKDEPAALVSVTPALDPLADELITSARRAAPVLVAGAGAAVRTRLSVEGTVPGGSRLLTSVRTLQEEGHGVMLVSARGGAALAGADVGIGIISPTGHPPWGAHLLCGPGLSEACLLLDSLIPAREASSRSARIATVGSAAGALLAATGTPGRSAQRAQLAVDMAGVSAMAVGTWTGLTLARRPTTVAADRTPWHAWPAKAVLARLDSSTSGLGLEESLRRRIGTSESPALVPGLARVTVEELDNPLTPALAAGAGVSAVVGSITDAALIGTVLTVNAVMSGLQRVGADRALQDLVDLKAVRVRLRRPAEDGGDTRATAAELVPGDVVMLSAGDAVPADCRLLSAKGLEVDESNLTGESQLVVKSPKPSVAGAVADRTSMLYEGTVVAAGEAVGVVVATGSRTEIGRTAAIGEERVAGGVEQRLRALTEVTLPIALGAGGVLFLSDLLRGQPIARALGPAVSLAVAAVPEGLPFVATAAELATARRMSKRGAIVRNPTTIEALGRIDVLCFDKTGTLTMGKLRLKQVSDGVSTWPIERPVGAGPRGRRRGAPRGTGGHGPPVPAPDRPGDHAGRRPPRHGGVRGAGLLETRRRAAVRAWTRVPRGARPVRGPAAPQREGCAGDRPGALHHVEADRRADAVRRGGAGEGRAGGRPAGPSRLPRAGGRRA